MFSLLPCPFCTKTNYADILLEHEWHIYPKYTLTKFGVKSLWPPSLHNNLQPFNTPDVWVSNEILFLRSIYPIKNISLISNVHFPARCDVHKTVSQQFVLLLISFCTWQLGRSEVVSTSMALISQNTWWW